MQVSLLPRGGETLEGGWVGIIGFGPCNPGLFRLDEVGSPRDNARTLGFYKFRDRDLSRSLHRLP